MTRPPSPYLAPGFYSEALATGRHRDIVGGRWDETGRAQMALLRDPARLDPSQLIEDHDFSFPGVPPTITHAIAFAVFPHLPLDALAQALPRLRARFPVLRHLFFTVFLAPSAHQGPFRQADGVVTHPDRPPRHFDAETVLSLTTGAGLAAAIDTRRLPRGQVLVCAQPA